MTAGRPGRMDEDELLRAVAGLRSTAASLVIADPSYMDLYDYGRPLSDLSTAMESLVGVLKEHVDRALRHRLNNSDDYTSREPQNLMSASRTLDRMMSTSRELRQLGVEYQRDLAPESRNGAPPRGATPAESAGWPSWNGP
jgi:hypothetical protein